MPIDEIVGEAIDRTVSIEMRFGSGLPRGVTQPLFDAAREVAGGPMCFRAATDLVKRVGRGDYVLIVTGAGAPPTLPRGETDGPPGAAALAHAVEVGLGAKPILISEDRNMPPTIASAEGIGLAVVDEPTFRVRGGVAHAATLPLGPEAGAAFAQDMFRRFEPKAVMFVEKLGPNEKGVCYTINGTARPPDVMGHAHLLASLAAERGVLSIGIGDGGNEIGCGSIHATVQKVQPRGRMSRVEGDGGIATVAKCDHLVFAAVSNWGAYGVAAALAGLLGRQDVLHGCAAERRMLERCVAAGAMDGAFARLIPYVDGTNTEVQTSLLTLLHQIVSNGLMSYDRGF